IRARHDVDADSRSHGRGLPAGPTGGRRGAMITVGVVTRNRPDLLTKCLTSLGSLGDDVGEVIVVDDSSTAPVDGALKRVPAAIAERIRVFRQDHNEGYIVGRNKIMAAASNEFVLLMDDDAWLLDAEGLREAVTLLTDDPSVGAVAFAMANAGGQPWDSSMQP